MRTFILLFTFVITYYKALYGQINISEQPFISPVKIPLFFSGGFGELRPSHFHSGIDIRTQGRTGIPVVAIKDGYISRISVSSTGYGNALYMNHPDGTTSVYGHLERFNPELQEYTKEKQYDREHFHVDITPLSGSFRFKQGEVIAWSGNSGSSGGPHLHFEIRDTHSEQTTNPLFHNFGIKDNSAPKIIALQVYPLTNSSNVGTSHLPKRFDIVAVPGGYRLNGNLPISLFGKIGFGIQAEDYFNGVGLKCGIYSATLYCDGKEIFGFEMNKFSFDDTRYSNAQGDYESYLKYHHWIQRLYRLPGNHLSIYKNDNTGILNLDDGEKHQLEIVVADAFKNKSTLKFTTISKKVAPSLPNTKVTKHFLYNQNNEFRNNEIEVEIPHGALYDHLDFYWKSSPRAQGYYSELHQVCTKYTPLHKPYSLAIRCEGLPDDLKDKALIVTIDPVNGKKSALGGSYSGGWVKVKTYNLGNFAVAIDKIPPTITPLSIKEKRTLTNTAKIQFKINDNLSGIKYYRGEIDGKWVLFEYDAKSDLLTYVFDKKRMAMGKNHLLRLVVVDNQDNKAEYKAVFFK